MYYDISIHYLSCKLLSVSLHTEKSFSEPQLFCAVWLTPFHSSFKFANSSSLARLTNARELNCNETDETLLFSSNSLNFNLETYLQL